MPIHNAAPAPYQVDTAGAPDRPCAQSDADQMLAAEFPTITGQGRETGEWVSPGGAKYAIIECPNGFYWVERDSADHDISDSGACYPAYADARDAAAAYEKAWLQEAALLAKAEPLSRERGRAA
ncbi:hypothetical protein ACXR2T_08025 [Leucobacter sp. HY1910]